MPKPSVEARHVIAVLQPRHSRHGRAIGTATRAIVSSRRKPSHTCLPTESMAILAVIVLCTLRALAPPRIREGDPGATPVKAGAPAIDETGSGAGAYWCAASRAH